jgi:hypothetical protein
MFKLKTVWDRVSGNLFYDLGKFAFWTFWPTIWGLILAGIWMFLFYLGSQPPGFFAMLLVFGIAFLLATCELIRRHRTDPDIIISNQRLKAMSALVFLGIPIGLFFLSKVSFSVSKPPKTDEQLPPPKTAPEIPSRYAEPRQKDKGKRK